MAGRFRVGDRVDGLYDGNSDDVWYPGHVHALHEDDDTYDILYDDGESEHHVHPQYIRGHVQGTLCVGTRVFARYAGGGEWYPGKIQEVTEGGAFTIEYDDGEVEAHVTLPLICETLESANEDVEPTSVVPANVEPEELATEDAGNVDGTEDLPEQHGQVEANDHPEEYAPVKQPDDNAVEKETTTETPQSVVLNDVRDDATPTNAENATVDEELDHQRPHERQQELPAAVATPRMEADSQEEEPARRKSRPREEPQHLQVVDPSHERAMTDASDEYATILSTMEQLESSYSDAVAAKTLLSTLVKQMRAFPQATAELVHTRNGEALLIDILSRHHTHAVIQCYGFVLLRRLCFLCGKSTHFFLRNGIVDLITIAMRKYAEDAILQAAACGALAVFTRVHAGLTALLEHRVSHLVLATIIVHKTYSVHTRQVHYYACEVLLELCELGDKTTIDALCGDAQVAGPVLSELFPVSLLLFLLRQALSFDDKKACCAVGTLLMCLVACHRPASQIMLDLNGLTELSTVMAKYPMEPGIQKYAASASREITACSVVEYQVVEPSRHSNSKSKGTGSTKRKAPTSVSGLNGFPSPTHQQHVGMIAAHSRDALSFSKFASPIGKAPHLPPHISSPSAHHQINRTHSPLVILDGQGSALKDKRLFVKEERQNLLFETYGVDAKTALVGPTHSDVRTQGIKRRQLKTHIVSAADSKVWASPVKATILKEDKPLSSRANDKPKSTVVTSRKIQSSGGNVSGSSSSRAMAVDDESGEEGSPATLRKQETTARPPGRGTRTTKSDHSSKAPRSTTFQLKLESGAAGGKGDALSPTSGRKTNAKPPTKSAIKTSATALHRIKANDSSESLNSYATQLFREEMAAPVESTSAQERERLSFAEKLHKMIDKAKMSLAQGSTTTLEHNAPTKPKRREQEMASAPVAKTKKPALTSGPKVVPSVSVVTKPAAVVSNSEPKKPVKKVTGVSASLYTPKVVKREAVVRPAAVVASKTIKPKPASATRTEPKQAIPAVKEEADVKKAAKEAGDAVASTEENPAATETAEKTAEPVEDQSLPTATPAVPGVEESPESEPNSTSEAHTEEAQATETVEPTEPSPVDSDREEKASSAATDESKTETPPEEEESVAAVKDAPESPKEAVAEVPAGEKATSEEEAVITATVAVSSAADDLYADEYNDFDDLDGSDNAPPTVDDDGTVEPSSAMDRDVSFEALMTLTARVAASEAVQEEPLFTVAQPDDGDVQTDPQPVASTEEVAEVEPPQPAAAPHAVESEENATAADDDSASASEPPECVSTEKEEATRNGEEAGVVTATEGASVEQQPTPATEEAVTNDEQMPESSETPTDQHRGETESPLLATEAQALESAPPADKAKEDVDASPAEPASDAPADRPDSRQIDVSYADEDFEDTPEEPTEADATEQSVRDEAEDTPTFEFDTETRVGSAADEASPPEASEEKPVSLVIAEPPEDALVAEDTPPADESFPTNETVVVAEEEEDVGEAATPERSDQETTTEPETAPIAATVDAAAAISDLAADDPLVEAQPVDSGSTEESGSTPDQEEEAVSVDEPEQTTTNEQDATDHTPLAPPTDSDVERVATPDAYGDAAFDDEPGDEATSPSDDETPSRDTAVAAGTEPEPLPRTEDTWDALEEAAQVADVAAAWTSRVSTPDACADDTADFEPETALETPDVGPEVHTLPTEPAGEVATEVGMENTASAEMEVPTEAAEPATEEVTPVAAQEATAPATESEANAEPTAEMEMPGDSARDEPEAATVSPPTSEEHYESAQPSMEELAPAEPEIVTETSTEADAHTEPVIETQAEAATDESVATMEPPIESEPPTEPVTEMLAPPEATTDAEAVDPTETVVMIDDASGPPVTTEAAPCAAPEEAILAEEPVEAEPNGDLAEASGDESAPDAVREERSMALAGEEQGRVASADVYGDAAFDEEEVSTSVAERAQDMIEDPPHEVGTMESAAPQGPVLESMEEATAEAPATETAAVHDDVTTEIASTEATGATAIYNTTDFEGEEAKGKTEATEAAEVGYTEDSPSKDEALDEPGMTEPAIAVNEVVTENAPAINTQEPTRVATLEVYEDAAFDDEGGETTPAEPVIEEAVPVDEPSKEERVATPDVYAEDTVDFEEPPSSSSESDAPQAPEEAAPTELPAPTTATEVEGGGPVDETVPPPDDHVMAAAEVGEPEPTEEDAVVSTEPIASSDEEPIGVEDPMAVTEAVSSTEPAIVAEPVVMSEAEPSLDLDPSSEPSSEGGAAEAGESAGPDEVPEQPTEVDRLPAEDEVKSVADDEPTAYPVEVPKEDTLAMSVAETVESVAESEGSSPSTPTNPVAAVNDAYGEDFDKPKPAESEEPPMATEPVPSSEHAVVDALEDAEETQYIASVAVEGDAEIPPASSADEATVVADDTVTHEEEQEPVPDKEAAPTTAATEELPATGERGSDIGEVSTTAADEPHEVKDAIVTDVPSSSSEDTDIQSVEEKTEASTEALAIFPPDAVTESQTEDAVPADSTSSTTTNDALPASVEGAIEDVATAEATEDDPADEYAFDDEPETTTATADPVVTADQAVLPDQTESASVDAPGDEVTSSLPPTEATVSPSQGDEDLYNDVEQALDLETPRTVNESDPASVKTEPTPTESPKHDDVEYDDFEPEDSPTATASATVPLVEYKETSPDTQDAEYADDADEYNDFEDDTTPPVTAKPVIPAEEEDYAAEEEFEEEEAAKSARIEQPVEAVTALLAAPTTPTSEEDYYDEFED